MDVLQSKKMNTILLTIFLSTLMLCIKLTPVFMVDWRVRLLFIESRPWVFIKNRQNE